MRAETTSTPTMYIIDSDVMFSFRISLWIIDDKQVLFLFEELIKVPQLFSFVEEDDDLKFELEFAEFFQNVKDNFILARAD